MSDGDDGIILNFATNTSSTPAPRVHAKKSGGRWKDRLKEKRRLKAQARRVQNGTTYLYKKGEQNNTNASQEDINDTQNSGSTTKMQKDTIRIGSKSSKVNTEAENTEDEVNKLLSEINGGSAAQKSVPNPSLSSQAGKQIISSLFTKNPEIPTLQPRDDNQVQNLSSNAVVDTSSFEGLGLDNDIISFLENKMDITKPTAIQQQALPVLINNEQLVSAQKNANNMEDDDDDTFDVDSEVKTERDSFIQAATGSGKTLTYLLPIFHRLLKASTMTTHDGSRPSRDLGTFAIILTPTRELAQQVYETALSLINMPLTRDSGKRTHWMVPGVVIGGDKKQSEKSRLRKGITILSCTPGRLLDHLENTKSFNIGHLRWLVLDEADRLLELGFEETLSKILAILDERTKNRPKILGRAVMANSKDLPNRRLNILCSATIKDDVRRLANESLNNPRFISASKIHDTMDQAAEDAKKNSNAKKDNINDLESDNDEDVKFSVPSQLVQKAIIVPAKLRLVTLVAQIKNTLRKQPSSKMIVFLSCKDSVDFMYFLFAHAGKAIEEGDSSKHINDLFDDAMEGKEDPDSDSDSSNSDNDGSEAKHGSKSSGSHFKRDNNGPKLNDDEIVLDSSVFSGTKLYRLHGSMQQKRRTETFLAFSKSTRASILFTTDVAARGLDLPNVTSIIQFDPPSDVSSYLHRVGRTARLGRVGEAVIFLLPSESKYIALLSEKGLRPEDESMETVLKSIAKHEGIGKVAEWQLRAGEMQATLEKFVVANSAASGLAKQAYLSSIRAYATHVSAERHIFHIRFLHFGHLAKAFALREAPSQVASGKGNNVKAVSAKKEKKDKNEKIAAQKKKYVLKRTNDISEFAVGDISAYYGPRVKRNKE